MSGNQPEHDREEHASVDEDKTDVVTEQLRLDVEAEDKDGKDTAKDQSWTWARHFVRRHPAAARTMAADDLEERITADGWNRMIPIALKYPEIRRELRQALAAQRAEQRGPQEQRPAQQRRRRSRGEGHTPRREVAKRARHREEGTENNERNGEQKAESGANED